MKYWLLLALILPLVACGEEQSAEDNGQSKIHSGKTEKLVIQTASGVNHKFDVELAIETPQIIMGLMHRESMPQNHGMLFFFGQEAERRFWMKNTLIPLDMLFIKADGTIHHIHENAVPKDLTPVPSKGKVTAVLELNGGVSSKLGLQKGDKIDHHLFAK